MIIDSAGGSEPKFPVEGKCRRIFRVHFKLYSFCLIEEMIEGEAEHLPSHALVPGVMDDSYSVKHPRSIFHGRVQNPDCFVLEPIQERFSVCLGEQVLQGMGAFLAIFSKGITHYCNGSLFVLFSNQLKGATLFLVHPMLSFKHHHILAAIELWISFLKIGEPALAVQLTLEERLGEGAWFIQGERMLNEAGEMTLPAMVGVGEAIELHLLAAGKERTEKTDECVVFIPEEETIQILVYIHFRGEEYTIFQTFGKVGDILQLFNFFHLLFGKRMALYTIHVLTVNKKTPALLDENRRLE